MHYVHASVRNVTPFYLFDVLGFLGCFNLSHRRYNLPQDIHIDIE